MRRTEDEVPHRIGSDRRHRTVGQFRRLGCGDVARRARIARRRRRPIPARGRLSGSGGRGRIVGAPPATSAARRALALLYVALQTDACLTVMGENATTVLDGSFVRDPLYAALVAALRPGSRILFSTDAYGTAAGAALLADHEVRQQPVDVEAKAPQPLSIPGLAEYASRWRKAAADGTRA